MKFTITFMKAFAYGAIVITITFLVCCLFIMNLDMFMREGVSEFSFSVGTICCIVSEVAGIWLPISEMEEILKMEE